MASASGISTRPYAGRTFRSADHAGPEGPACVSGTDRGFALAESLIAVAILLIIMTTVTSALLQLSTAERSIWNRTEMHSSVRSATELLQQEVGQAGRVALPGVVTLAGPATFGSQLVRVSSAAGMFVGEQLVVDAGAAQETVALTAVNAGASQITAMFTLNHAAGAAVIAVGGFASGIVPPAMANGSTGGVLKMFGDINSDGNMVYIEYTCDTVQHSLSRNVMAWNAASKPALTSAQILLSNIVANPSGTPCFLYQTEVVGANTYVTDVAITLTVQTQKRDPLTNLFQTETKTLLNVSPRNVFDAWELASIGLVNRIQPMPPSIMALLH